MSSTSSVRELLNRIKTSLTSISDNYVPSVGFEDQFGKGVQDSTRNNANLGAHYPFNPERFRFYETSISESNRIFLQYNKNDGRYDHQRFNQAGEWDVHQIKPSSGETLIFKTAERFRYIVGYETSVTQAFSINQSLQSGDTIQMGPEDGTDGYGIEFRGELGDEQGEIFIKRDGNKVSTKVVQLGKPITEFTRREMKFAWYNIGSGRAYEAFTSNGKTLNKYLNGISVDGGRGPRWGNLPITITITAGPSTTNLIANVGSMAWQTYGDVKPIVKPKTFGPAGLSTINYSGTGDWEPLLAIRKDPLRDIVNVQLTDINFVDFTGSGDFYLLAQSFSSQNVLDSGGNTLVDADFFVPEETAETNSVIEVSQNTAQIPDNTGSTATSVANPGGFQIGYASRYSIGTGQATEIRRGAKIEKRNLVADDILVIIGKSEQSNSGDVLIEPSVEQQW